MNHICFTCDGNYLRALEVAIFSILRNGQGAEITFHIIKNSDFNQDYISRLVDEYGARALFYDFKPEMQAPGRFTGAIYTRLYLDQILNDSIDKVLYLDCDLVVNKDLNSLFSIELGEYCLAAVKDIGDSHINKIKSFTGCDSYFNSGVIFFNMFEMKRVDMFKQARDKYSTGLKYADQDMLNMAVGGKWLELPSIYNYMSSSFSPTAAIVHYAHCKPWEFFNFNRNSEYYYNYEVSLSSESELMRPKFDIKRIIRNIYMKITGG